MEKQNLDAPKGAKRSSASGALLLVVLYFLAELFPFAGILLLALIVTWAFPELASRLWDPESRLLLFAFGAFIGTIFVLFNHDFWTGFFTELIRRDRPVPSANRIQ
jgi:hypothetical protein